MSELQNNYTDFDKFIIFSVQWNHDEKSLILLSKIKSNDKCTK